MKREFTPETVESVLGEGIVPSRDGMGDKIKILYRRRPLHVDYGPGPGFVPSRDAEDVNDPEEFNAVGSRAQEHSYATPGERHLPVLDLDGGAEAQALRLGSKAILYAHYDANLQERRRYADKYNPRSVLRDVLGDNGIETEVFQGPLSYSSLSQVSGSLVRALALRSKEPDKFAVFPSTHADHAHLYIQHPFLPEDHRTLLGELADIGMISEHWHQLAEKEGMGIVRTPWTKQERVHQRS